jgi:hypothetical protein
MMSSAASSQGTDGDRSPRATGSSASKGAKHSSWSLGIHPFVITVFTIGMSLLGVYIAAPQLFNEAYWLTHQFHELKVPAEAAGSGGDGGAGGSGAGGGGGKEARASGGGGGGGDGDVAGGKRDGSKKAAGGGGGGGGVGKKNASSPSPPSPRSAARKRLEHGKKASGGGKKFEKVGSDEARAKTPKVYDVGRVALTPGCQIGHVDHTDCRQLVLSRIRIRLRIRIRIRPTWVVTSGCQIGYVDDKGLSSTETCFDCKRTW